MDDIGTEREKEKHRDYKEGRKKKERNTDRNGKDIKKRAGEIKKGKKAMGSDLKGWYCILVAMVTESQNSKSSRTANRRPHPEQANLHRSAGAPHRYAPQHISMLNTEDNYFDAFCPDTLFFCNPL